MFEAFAMDDIFAKYGAVGLIFMAFIESFIFPVPPDPVLMSLGLMNPSEAIMLGLYTTVASVLGGMFGYYIGVQAGRPVVLKLFKERHVNKVTKLFAQYGGWAVFVAGLTPIPYKVFTITAGISKINFITFVVASFAGRGLRFTLIGVLIYFYGERAVEIVRSSFETGTIAIAGVVVLVMLVYLKFIKKD